MAGQQSKKVVIVGGSLGGLFAGIVFIRLGYNVTILERTPASVLQDQGAGISLYIIIPPIMESLKKLGTSGSPIVDFLEQYDRTKTPTLSCRGIFYLNRDGSVKQEVSGRTGEIASWDLLYNILRANFDGGYEAGYIGAAERKEGDGNATYLSGVRVSGLQEVGPDLMKVEYESRDGSKGSLEANIVVGADGPSSTVRKLLLPKVERTYSGYVAWRGTVKESLLSEETSTFLGSKSFMAFSKGNQSVAYKIPGLKGSLAPGEQLANLVWYCNADKEKLQKILTDSAGISHSYSLGIGKIKPELREEQRKVAAANLSPPMAEIFQRIESPFIQAITDNLVSKSIFLNGKVLLLGDAVAGMRPHTTAGCSQSAMNALLLKKVFEKDGQMSIEEWEKTTLGWATFAQKMGVQMGNLSQFGDHPLADNAEPLDLRIVN